MSIFSRDVRAVSGVEMFARLTGRGTQVLVCRFEYVSEREVAVIVPVPVARHDSDAVRFPALTGYRHFFLDLNLCFSQPRSLEAVYSPTAEPVRVEDVKAEEGLFVPDLATMRALDGRFTLDAATWDLLPQYLEFGFCVFRLPPTGPSVRGRVSPLALEFATCVEHGLYFPILHAMPAGVPEVGEFDHWLYCQVPETDEARARIRFDEWTRSDDVVGTSISLDRARGVVDPTARCHRLRLEGALDNDDWLLSA